MALPTFYRRTAMRRAAIDRYLLPARPQQHNLLLSTAAQFAAVVHAGTDGRTDGRTPNIT